MSVEENVARGRVEVIGGVVEGLKGSPTLLALIVLCALVFGLTYWSVQKQQDRTQALIERLMDRCLMDRPYPRQSTVSWARGGGQGATK